MALPDKCYFAWDQGTVNARDIFTGRSDTDGSGFSSTQQTNDGKPRGWVDLTVSPDRMHLLWSEHDGSSIYQLHLGSCDLDGTNWVDVTLTSGGSHKTDGRVMRCGNKLYYFYRERDGGGNWQVTTAWSDLDGGNFTATMRTSTADNADNPGLDVRAVREIEEVTVGVRVGGTMKTPRIDLFSSPAMGESDVLSYLLTGRPAGEGGETVGIAAAIKATGAGVVAEELGRQFGLEELRLDAGSAIEEASVVAGTYLSPRLYIQYINELASRETKLRLRYDINQRMQLEAETGKTQAGDLYYTFDR